MFTITFGGWYQRTTLHLSEVYDLLDRGHSKLLLSPHKLLEFHQKLNLKSVSRENGYLEFVHAFTNDGIEIKYYEDGLYILSIKSDDIESAHGKLESYYNDFFGPAISYIFSLGAPTPKILADIKITNPTVVFIQDTKFNQSKINTKQFGEIYSQITSEKYSVFKTPHYIFIASPNNFQKTHELVEMQIFFREFKDQLERYLNIHRTIWEKIQSIKERPLISGKLIGNLRNDLDAYQKTINLISSRIDQMSTYVNTRANIAAQLKIEDELSSIFQYKFETLSNTHVYIQDIWVMTKEYLDTALQVISDVQDQNSDKTLESLRLITTMGVFASVLDYFAKDSFPSFTAIGFWYFIILVVGTFIINKLITFIYQNIKYRLEFSKNKT